MNMNSFDVLLQLVHEDLEYQTTHFRKPISPTERLLITLRFLASGHTYTALHYEFRMGISTVQKIVMTTCEVLWKRLQPRHMCFPTVQKWIEIADNYWMKHNFPNCLGAIDGKHIRLVCPPCSGSKFFNYKKYFSIVLMAVVDADYRFTYIDIGNYGSNNDASIFQKSKLGMKLADGKIDLPPPSPWPGKNNPQPYTFVADEGFGLSIHVMRPYSQKTKNEHKDAFNYHLTRARRVVECTFGIMTNKFRVLHTAMQLHPQNAVKVVKAACILHNFIRDMEGGIVNESVQTEQPLQTVCGRVPRSCSSALNFRDEFAKYFAVDAPVAWQDDVINK
ncbi:uncharacterized protein [Hyperolius riggenbachi]|uniref:uncharacterized protein n=1 Tax=Hyperolius riggenbachi TaxID=752182 RepID=UPI0035A3360F